MNALTEPLAEAPGAIWITLEVTVKPPMPEPSMTVIWSRAKIVVLLSRLVMPKFQVCVL